MMHSGALLAGMAGMAVSLGLGAPSLARGPGPFPLETTAAWGGAVNAFQRVGNYGYCGSGQRLVVLDMSDETAIHEVACVHMKGTVQDVAAQNGYLYVALENMCPNSLVTLSLANPQTPVVTWAEPSWPIMNLAGIRVLGSR